MRGKSTSTTATQCLVLGILAGLALGRAGEARASSISVSPTRVFLSARATSALISVRNESGRPLRFQLSVTSWAQSPTGQMQVAPTDDVVFFPELLTLEAQEERKIRVGALVSPGTAEKSYRLFIEELPSRTAPSEGRTVNVLVKVSVPIFLQPARSAGAPALRDLGLQNGTLRFDLRNQGSAHILPKTVVVRGSSAATGVVFERTVDVWYVLAGGSRLVELLIPAQDCPRIDLFTVELQTEDASMAEVLRPTEGACGR